MSATIIAIRLRERGLLGMVEAVAQEHNVTVDELLGVCRQRHIVQARHAAWRKVASAMPTWSSTSLGDLFGVNHTTVLYALERTAESRRRKADKPDLVRAIERGVQRGLLIAGSRR